MVSAAEKALLERCVAAETMLTNKLDEMIDQLTEAINQSTKLQQLEGRIQHLEKELGSAWTLGENADLPLD